MPLAGLAIAGMSLSIALVTIWAMALPYLRRREAQKTLRDAIAKGQTLDLEVVDRLLGPERRGGGKDLAVSGIITISVGLGIAVLAGAIWLGQRDAKGAWALAGTGGLIVVVGFGLLAAARITGPGNGADRGSRET